MRVRLLKVIPLPKMVKLAGVQKLLSVFAGTFDVEAPNVRRMTWDGALGAFREFSFACVQEACVSPSFAKRKRMLLESRARELGEQLRRLIKPKDDELAELVSFLYSLIKIDVDAVVPGIFRFRRCYFSVRYTPETCSFMSAFDSGFVSGLCGNAGLKFETRMTEGAPCCLAICVRKAEGS